MNSLVSISLSANKENYFCFMEPEGPLDYPQEPATGPCLARLIQATSSYPVS
jgi:hypothetical protein